MAQKGDRAGRIKRMKEVKEILGKEMKLISSVELAHKMGVTPSWFWRTLFTEMWNNGEIVACAVKLRNGKDAFFWGDKSLDCYTQLRLQGLES